MKPGAPISLVCPEHHAEAERYSGVLVHVQNAHCVARFAERPDPIPRCALVEFRGASGLLQCKIAVETVAQHAGHHLLGFKLLGAPQPTERRDAFRARAPRSEMPVEIDGARGSLADASADGIAVLTEGPLAIDSTVTVGLMYEDLSLHGKMVVRNCVEIRPGVFRCGLQPAESENVLLRDLGKLSIDLQLSMVRRHIVERN